MHTNIQHPAQPNHRDRRTDEIAGPSAPGRALDEPAQASPGDRLARPRAGVRRRTLQGVAVGALSITFAFAGQSVAHADDHWDGQWDGHWAGADDWHDWSGDDSEAYATAPAPAPAPEAAPAPAPAPAPALVVVPAAIPADLTGTPTPTSTDYSAWAPHVRPVVAEVVQTFGVPTVYTRPGHSPTQELAADFMVYDNLAMGDAVAQFVIDNAARLNVDYVIWQQRIFMIGGSSWTPMEDRGSPTANHMDHVHVSFNP